LKPKIVIPMHFFSQTTLEQFVALFAARYPVKRSESATVVLARPSLPDRQLLLLPGH
jgi:hypothetical protein